MKNEMLENLLHNLGLSQITLANFIGVEDTEIGQYIDGHKILPEEALEQAKLLTKKILSIKKLPRPQASEKDKKNMLERAAIYKLKYISIQKRLADIQHCYHQACLMELLLDALGNAKEGDHPNKQRWLNNQRYEATKKQYEHGWYAQLNLEIIIARLKLQADFWENAVK